MNFLFLAIIVTLSITTFYVSDSIQNSFFEVHAQSEQNNHHENPLSPDLNSTNTIAKKNFSNEYSMKRPDINANNKIHPAIPKILGHANPNAMASLFDTTIENNSLFVYVYFEDDKFKNLPKDIDILAQDQNVIATKLSLSQIQSISNLDSVRKVTLPEFAEFYTHDISEGVEFSLADNMHSAGFNGTGVKVAVIDDSFFINNAEISSNIVHSQLFNSSGTCNGNFTGDISCGENPLSSHGTAVAEIIVDMAPEVELLVYSIGSRVDFNNAVDVAISQGADIITASLGFPGQGGDGTNPNDWFRDGTSSVAKKVNNATDSGVLFTVAAGNDGDSHWSGTYIPLNSTDLTGAFGFDMTNPKPQGPHTVAYESVMLFNSTATETNMKACLPITDEGSTYRAAWNAWPETSTEDYDIFLYSADMTVFLAYSSEVPQYPGNWAPIETIFFTPALGDVCLVVASYTSSEDHLFHINLGDGGSFRNSTYITPQVSIDTPADAEKAFSVGAISFNETPANYNDDFLENFSSQGPTDDGRPKPEICGPDRTLTHQTALNSNSPGTFPGTSASTPHVAGAAALLLQQNPTLTVDQLKQKLTDDARFNSNFSVDNQCGSDSGSLQLIPPCSPPASGNWIVNSSCELSGNAAINGGSLIVQDGAVLTIPGTVTLDIDFENHNLTVKSGSGILIKSGGAIT